MLLWLWLINRDMGLRIYPIFYPHKVGQHQKFGCGRRPPCDYVSGWGLLDFWQPGVFVVDKVP